jgi:hypothetical protein
LNEIVVLDKEGDGPERNSYRQSNPVPETVVRPKPPSPVKKANNVIEIKDVEVEVESEHNYKGARCCLLLI